MNDQEKKRKLQQRAARDRQLDNIEQALNRATDLIQDSQREIQRSRELMQDRRDQDRRDDLAEDARGTDKRLPPGAFDPDLNSRLR